MRSWKTEAASTASAPPMTAAFAKPSSWPAPPEATIGVSTAARTARSISRSKPACVPSASTDVRRISPAPAAAAAAAHPVTGRSVGRRPPCVITRITARPPVSRTRFPSIATTTHCAPNCSASLVIRKGSSTAAVFTVTRLAEPRDQEGILDRGGVHGHAVGSGAEKRVRVLHRPHASSHGKRNRKHFGHARGEVHESPALLVRGRDVEERQLVSPLGLVAYGSLDRIARVAEAFEGDAFDDAAVRHVEARDDTHRDRHEGLSRSRAARSRATVVAQIGRAHV